MLRKKIFILLSISAAILINNTSVKAYVINKETTDIHKSWNIKFSQKVNIDDENKSNIIVTDNEGNIIKTNLKLQGENVIVIEAPEEGYKEGETYTINIKKDFHSTNDKYLNEDVQCNFKVNKKEASTSEDYKYKDKVNKSINLGINKIIENKVEEEWQAVLIAKNGGDIPKDYITSFENKIKSSNGDLPQITDYSRSVLTILSLKGDPLNFQGYNFIEKIYNNEYMEEQGINGYIFALIALDSKDFDIPKNALWTRDKLINAILDCRTEDKGWDYAEYKADPDMTGMALIALSKYKDRQNVKIAIDEAVDKLSSMQDADGGFSSWGVANSESLSQVIMGLCANGIDPTDSKFVKNSKNLLDALLEYEVNGGGFSHSKGTGYNLMATEQALQALEAYKNLKEQNQGRLYTFN